MVVPAIDVLGVGAIEDAVPPVTLVPYQFKLFPTKAEAIKATGISFWQYCTGVVSGATGNGFTVTVAVAVPVQPFVVPITVYVVVIKGVTEYGFNVDVPESQSYVVPPVAVKTAVPPKHIDGEFTVITKAFKIVTVAVAVPTHPNVVPVTVYIVFTNGETTNGLAVDKPGFHE